MKKFEGTKAPWKIAAAPELLQALQDAVTLFEFVISATPIGKVRNAMCDFNIIALSLINKSL